LLFYGVVHTPVIQEPVIPIVVDWSSKGIMQCEISRRQEVWKHALQWHESQANPDATNPKDRDGTPSRGAYQFKWETLKGYTTKYKMLPSTLEKEDYINWTYDIDLTDEIVTRMLCDKDVNWANEFPDVIKRFIGMPPKN
jgi:hypothetical protein